MGTPAESNEASWARAVAGAMSERARGRESSVVQRLRFMEVLRGDGDVLTP
jgi:hypothetical protein